MAELENPIKKVRNQNGYSQESFADLIDMHPQAIMLNEAGCYSTILPRIKEWFLSQGYNVKALEEEYQNFIRLKRALNKTVYHFEDIEWEDFSFDEHPLIWFLGKIGMSRTRFAKELCIQPANLYKLEKGNNQGLSEQVKVAMLDVGFSIGFIEELDSRCIEYTVYKLSRLNHPALRNAATSG